MLDVLPAPAAPAGKSATARSGMYFHFAASFPAAQTSCTFRARSSTSASSSGDRSTPCVLMGLGVYVLQCNTTGYVSPLLDTCHATGYILIRWRDVHGVALV